MTLTLDHSDTSYFVVDIIIIVTTPVGSQYGTRTNADI